MKRWIIILTMVSIFLVFGGCQKEVVSDYYNQYEGYVLEGYQEDILPMYNMIAVDRCNLQVRDMMGGYRNAYALTYYTNASESQLLKFYKNILGENEYNSSDYMIGEIEGYDLTVSLQPREEDMRVVLNLELPEELSKETNMFFNNFPRKLIDKYVKEDEKMIEESFSCTSNKNGQLEYHYIYEANTNDDELIKVLTEHYGGNNDFVVAKTNDGNVDISWTASEYKVTFVYEDEYNQMNVSIREAMKKK